jgi:hypothetical protein
MKENVLLICALFCFCSTKVVGTEKSEDPAKSESAAEKKEETSTPSKEPDTSETFLKKMFDMAQKDPKTYSEIVDLLIKYVVQSNIEHVNTKYTKAVSLCLQQNMQDLGDGSFKDLLSHIYNILLNLIKIKKEILAIIETNKTNKEHPFSDPNDPLLAVVYAHLEYVNPNALDVVATYCSNISKSKEDLKDKAEKYKNLSEKLISLKKNIQDLGDLKNQLDDEINKSTVRNKFSDLPNLKKSVDETDKPA